ncbi:hypothetical protein [Streptomyces yangpuensis]|uniref:hypothetical protein n=1 Tax=Streptomyces yangpuensis TaxID=1648182 RepID=UPI00371D3139
MNARVTQVSLGVPATAAAARVALPCGGSSGTGTSIALTRASQFDGATRRLSRRPVGCESKRPSG